MLAMTPVAYAQELIENGTFDAGLVAWDIQIFDTSTVAWSALDAADSAESGSVRFAEDGTVGPNSVRMQQCLLVVGGTV